MSSDLIMVIMLSVVLLVPLVAGVAFVIVIIRHLNKR